MPRPNWFFAFPIPGAFAAQLPPPPTGFRSFHPEDLHLTLSFLGGCGQAAAERALAALDAATQDQPAQSLAVSLSRVVPMGPKREYSALSALLERGREPCRQLILGLRDVVSVAATGRREARAPVPHVTLARPPRRASADARRAGLLWAAGLDLGGVSAELNRVALYTWAEGGRQQRLFRIFAERPLRARLESSA